MSQDKSHPGAVGYGRPPVKNRFRPGQSGNPKGRRRGAKNMNSIIREMLSKKVTIREGDKIYKVTQFEAIMRNLVIKAMKADPRAIKMMLSLMEQTDVWKEEQIPPKVIVEIV
jgi:hypothetical protein